MLEEMDPSTIGWIKNYAKANHWRVYSWYGLDDLISDGYMRYYRVLRTYPEVKDRRQLMALFKRSYTNYIHDLSKKKTRKPECRLADEFTTKHSKDHTSLLEQVLDPQDFEELLIFYLDAPEPVRVLLRRLSDPKVQEQLRRPFRKYLSGRRETLNQRLCRLASYDYKEVDLASALRGYLRQAKEAC